MSNVDLTKAKHGDRFVCRNGTIMVYKGCYGNMEPLGGSELYPRVLQVEGNSGIRSYTDEGSYTRGDITQLDLVARIAEPECDELRNRIAELEEENRDLEDENGRWQKQFAEAWRVYAELASAHAELGAKLWGHADDD